MTITSYVCTQPNIHRSTFNDSSLCNFSSGHRTCETKGGARPTLLDGDTSGDSGAYIWYRNTNLFVVLGIPQGWCVGSGVIAFTSWNSFPAPSLSVHSAEHLSNNTDRTVIPILSEETIQNDVLLVVMNFTALARGRYLMINMTLNGFKFMTEIEVFDTGTYVHSQTHGTSIRDHCQLHLISSPSGNITSIPPASTIASPALSARPTTTSVHSSSFTTTPMSSQPSEYTVSCMHLTYVHQKRNC